MQRLFAILTAGALLLAGCAKGDGAEGGGADDRVPVVVDTDMGQDDMMAILYLLRRPDIQIKAITVSGTGLAHCDPGVGIALSILDIARAPKDIPVACGPDSPIPGEYPYAGAFPTSWRVGTDEAYGLDLPISERELSPEAAPELLRTTVEAQDAPVRLLTLGPLTNLAHAIRQDAGFLENVEDITVMGGAVDVPGNIAKNPVAEFNIWVDPVAAIEVLGSGADLTLVPLDATNGAPVTPFFTDALARHHNTPEADTVMELFRAQPHLTEGGYYFWDPMSAAALVEPSILTFEERRLAILEGTKETQGQVVEASDGSSVRVAVGVDAPSFEVEFLNTLNGNDAIESTRPDPAGTIIVEERSCMYAGPNSLGAGLVGVWAENQSGGPASVLFVSVRGRHSIADLRALAARYRPNDQPPAWIEPTARSTLDPNGEQLVPWVLSPGKHGIVCATADGSFRVAAGIRVP